MRFQMMLREIQKVSFGLRLFRVLKSYNRRVLSMCVCVSIYAFVCEHV